MSAGPRTLKKNEFLFREGDTSDSAYVIKSGRLAITKAKGASEIILAELGPGSMLGEMAFFDNRPRSAGAKAMDPTVVISLPFKALHAQFKTFPEWLKVMVKTINTHLRDANQKIKNLEQVHPGNEAFFTPYAITKLMAIITLVAHKYGEQTPEGITVPPGTLRKFTIQVFQEPTNKMQKFLEVLQDLRHLSTEDIGDGKQKIVLFNKDLLTQFVEYYNDYLFLEESKRANIAERELPIVRALLFYGRKKLAADGKATVSLTQMQNESMKDLGYLVKVDDVNTLISKGLISDKLTTEDSLSTVFSLNSLETLLPFWEIIYAMEKVTR